MSSAEARELALILTRRWEEGAYTNGRCSIAGDVGEALSRSEPRRWLSCVQRPRAGGGKAREELSCILLTFVSFSRQASPAVRELCAARGRRRSIRTRSSSRRLAKRELNKHLTARVQCIQLVGVFANSSLGLCVLLLLEPMRSRNNHRQSSSTVSNPPYCILPLSPVDGC